MADTKISALTELTTPASVDLFAIVDDPGGTPISKKITFANIEAALSITESQISDLGTYLTDIVSDTTPQLGGSLDVNGNKIVSVSNGNIDIEPNGTGNVLLGNFTFDADQTVGAGQDNYVLTYDNATGLISLEAAAGGGGGGAFTADGNSLISPTTSPTLNQATGNEVAFTLDYTVNKATSGNDTGLLVSMTDTASPGTSLLADFQVGGVSNASISSTGKLLIGGGISSGTGDTVIGWAGAGAQDYGITFDSSGVGFGSFGNHKVYWSQSGFSRLAIASGGALGFSSSASDASASADVLMYRDAANTLALRNSTNAQTFNIYNTYTDASNYERLEIKWDTNVATIQGVAAGTGTPRNMAIYGSTGTAATELVIDATPNRTSGNAKTQLFADGAGISVETTAQAVIFSRNGRPDTAGIRDMGIPTAEWGEVHAYQFCEKVNVIGSIGGGTQDIDMDSGTVVTGTVDTSTTTFTFSNPSPSGTASSFTLILTNGGSQTVNWPASVDWAGGSPPTLTAAGVDVITFTTVDGGTTWYGFPAGINMS